MEIDHCNFPDDLLYDVKNDIWVRVSDKRIGITNVLSFLSGKFRTIKLRHNLQEVISDQVIATVESSKYFAPIRSPAPGRISSFNLALETSPSLANQSPYGEGWVAEFSSFKLEDLSRNLLKGEAAREALGARIKELKVRCFKALPDEEMFSIGTECSTTLANLNQLLEKSPIGTVVHMVTDDPTADIEIIRWSDITKNSVLESRKEDNLFHFIVKKTRDPTQEK